MRSDLSSTTGNVPSPTSNRAVVIGLDGATWTLLDRLIARGVMPTLGRLRDTGVHGPLMSVIPPMTATAWTAYQTGKGPGKHGIFDWTEPVPGTYLYRPIDSTRVQSRTLFEHLGAHGKRVATVNLPLTFPARPINGIAVGDMLTPAKETPGFTFPESFKAELDRVVPDYVIDTHLCESEADILPFLARLRAMIEGRRKLVRHLMQQESWDFFCMVWVEMDRMQHCLWHIFDDQHPNFDDQLNRTYEKPILEIYTLLDTCVAEMVEMSAGANIYFISDHGFGHCRYKVFLNTWLAKEGFLKFKEGGRAQRDRLRKVRGALDRLGVDTRKILDVARKVGGDRALTIGGDSLSRFAAEIDWEHTEAFCHGTNSIRINLKGRDRQGSVTPERYAEVVQRLKDRLSEVTDPEGNRVIQRVAHRSELYSGPETDMAADVLIADHDDSIWFYYSEGAVPDSIFEPSGWASGNHKPDGLFLAVGPDIQQGKPIAGANIVDILPTLFAGMNMPIPDDVDGTILREVFRADRIVRPMWCEAAEWKTTTADVRSSAVDAAITERLRGLGYLQ